MSLTLIFRLNAAFAALWGLQLVFVPSMVFAQYGWTYSVELVAIALACGTAMSSLAIISWMTPTWTDEAQLKKAALWFAITAALFTLMQAYQFTGLAMDYVSTGITIIFMIAFYMKSK